ncbi:MAG: DUF1800 family protein, partial [Pyrinomonadaceae bacterium]
MTVHKLSQKFGLTLNNLKHALATTCMIALTVNSFALPLPPSLLPSKAPKSTPATLTGDKKILHVLNRLTFGARPGDVERVRAMGVDKFIEQQLNPEKIDDSAVVAKLAPFPSLTMSIAELYEKYPQPGKLIRELKKQGKLP